MLMHAGRDTAMANLSVRPSKLSSIWNGYDMSFFQRYRRYKIPRGTP